MIYNEKPKRKKTIFVILITTICVEKNENYFSFIINESLGTQFFKR